MLRAVESTLKALEAAIETNDRVRARELVVQLRAEAPESAHLAAEVMHELRQPLLGVKAYAQLMGEEGAPQGPLALLLAQVQRIEQILGDFKRLSARREAPRAPLPLDTPLSLIHI